MVILALLFLRVVLFPLISSLSILFNFIPGFIHILDLYPTFFAILCAAIQIIFTYNFSLRVVANYCDKKRLNMQIFFAGFLLIAISTIYYISYNDLPTLHFSFVEYLATIILGIIYMLKAKEFHLSAKLSRILILISAGALLCCISFGFGRVFTALQYEYFLTQSTIDDSTVPASLSPDFPMDKSIYYDNSEPTLTEKKAKITVTAKDHHYFVKVMRKKQGNFYLLNTFFLHEDSSYTFNSAQGLYQIYYSTGDNWIDSDCAFGESGKYYKTDLLYLLDTDPLAPDEGEFYANLYDTSKQHSTSSFEISLDEFTEIKAE